MKTNIRNVFGGGIVVDGGCTANGNTIAAGTYTSIDSTGTPTE